MIKTPHQILERISSPESIDFFNVQRTNLISLLPYDLAKQFLQKSYTDNYDNLPEDEKWTAIDPEEALMRSFPYICHLMDRDNFMETKKGLLTLKTLLWVVNEDFHDSVQSFFEEPVIANMEEGLKIIFKHFNYVPSIENIDFEEIED